MRSKRKHDTKIGLALAGGGPEGAVYELGALRAIEEAIDGLDLCDLDHYVGVSAGAFVGSNLANGMSTKSLIRAIVSKAPGEHPFDPEMFFSPAVNEFIRSGIAMPGLFVDAVQDYLTNRQDQGILGAFTKMARAVPVGLFNNEPIRRYLEKIYDHPRRTDSFYALKRKLYVVATDLDSGKAIVFGKDRRDVPISRAVQASTALPGVYPPVVIDGRHYVDGVLLKTLHASTLLEEGIDLALCVNPIVPVDTSNSVATGWMRRGKLVDRGMVTILSQTFRTLIHSRMNLGFRDYDTRYPDKDVLLFEARHDDYRMFFTNIFRFSSRKAVCEHAFKSTLADLKQRESVLRPILAKHGLRLRDEIINNPHLDVWETCGLRGESSAHAVTLKLSDTLAQLESKIRMRQALQEDPRGVEAKKEVLSGGLSIAHEDNGILSLDESERELATVGMVEGGD